MSKHLKINGIIASSECKYYDSSYYWLNIQNGKYLGKWKSSENVHGETIEIFELDNIENNTYHWSDFYNNTSVRRVEYRTNPTLFVKNTSPPFAGSVKRFHCNPRIHFKKQ